MKNLFSISETARMVGMTSETLRHYDRIGLVKPCRVDEWTGYRYYSRNEIVMLNTIRMLRCMDLTLDEIKTILSYDDFGDIVGALKRAEDKADEKIAELNFAKERIGRARMYYQGKLSEERHAKGIFVQELPQRVILLSRTMQSPGLDNLYNYHKSFFEQLPRDKREQFSFEDAAGIYESEGKSSLFAVCTRYGTADGLKILPGGRYLCADCTQKDRAAVTAELVKLAGEKYGAVPRFTVQMIVVSGILHWNFQAQVPIS